MVLFKLKHFINPPKLAGARKKTTITENTLTRSESIALSFQQKDLMVKLPWDNIK